MRLASCLLLATLLASATAEARRKPRAPRPTANRPTAYRPAANRPAAYNQKKLLQLITHVLREKSTLRSTLARIDRKLRKATPAVFSREPIDEQHPALSTPWDLPKAEYPNRAVVRREIRLFGVPAELRVVAPLAALDPIKGAALLNDRKATLVLMLTAKERSHPLPFKQVKKLFARLGLSVFASGRLGSCDAKVFCQMRRYVFLPKKGRRKGTVLLELGQADGEPGGFKVIGVAH